MNGRLLERQQTHIIASGREYPLNTSYRAALSAKNILAAVSSDGLDPLTASYAAAECMLGIDSLENDMSMNELNEAVKGIFEYISKYAKITDGDKNNNEPPLLDLEQDAQLIFDAFMKMGIDLDQQDISYPRFMSLLRELPEDCQLCRIVYLRQQNRRGKLTKEERTECDKRGWDVINIQDKRKQKQNDDFEW